MYKKIMSTSEVKVHLYKFGFKPNYLFGTNHGEEVPHINLGVVSCSSGGVDINDFHFTEMKHMMEDAVRPSLRPNVLIMGVMRKLS